MLYPGCNLQDDVDIEEFVEAYQAVLQELGDAENDCYSANFADFSGGGQLKGSNFLKKARQAITTADKNFDLVMQALRLE